MDALFLRKLFFVFIKELDVELKRSLTLLVTHFPVLGLLALHSCVSTALPILKWEPIQTIKDKYL